jgi:S1-C subfamily serine protease
MRRERGSTDLLVTPSAPVPTAPTPATSGPPTKPTPARRWVRWWPAAVVVALLCAGLVAVDQRATSRPATSEADVNDIVDEKVGAAVTALQSQPPASVSVYEAIVPPLVVIEAERSGRRGDASGLGSGVIVNARGDILTSLHVVEGATSIKVSFSDGTESPATIRSTDPDHDIAVLSPSRLPEVVVPAVLGGGARIGEEAFVVGHPLGLVGSLSTGVISGLDRSFPLGNGRNIGGMIQFDAAVNPGNSGGPLLNRNGQVIGIVTGLANPSGDDRFSGIGFAVPIGTAGGAAGAPAR